MVPTSRFRWFVAALAPALALMSSAPARAQDQATQGKDAAQPADNTFQSWYLKSTSQIDPTFKPNVGVRVPGARRRADGSLFNQNFPPGERATSVNVPWSIRASVAFFGVDNERASSRLQEYRDVDDGAAVGVEARYRGYTSVFNLTARDLGQRTQGVDADGGVIGKLLWSFTYDKIPHTFALGAPSLYAGSGGSVLTIADNIQADIQNSTTLPEATEKLTQHFNQNAVPEDASLRRLKLGGDVTLVATYPFTLKAGFTNESRDGVRPGSGTFGFYDFNEIPVPVKYDTRETRLTGEWSRPEGRTYWNATYRYSSFIDRYQSVTFDNPLRATDSLGTFTATFLRGPATGRMALYPSNSYQEGSASTVIKRLPMRSTLSAFVSLGYARQDEPLLPFSSNSGVTLTSPVTGTFNATDLAGLPRATAKTAMNTSTAQARWTATLGPKLSFVQQYRFYGLANHEEPFAISMFVREDQEPRPPETPGAFYRTVLAENSKHTSTSELSYAMPGDARIGLTYTFDRTNRTLREVASMNDNKIKLAFDTRKLGILDLRTWYEFTDRAASSYLFNQYNDNQGNPVAQPALPLLRKFDEADYHKNEFQAMVTAYLGEAVSISAHADAVRTSYTDSPFGVAWDRRRSFGADVTVSPGERWNLFADIGLERNRYLQGARSWRAPVPASPSAPFAPEPGFPSNSNWTALPADEFYSAGLGFDAWVVPDRVRVNAQYSFSRSNGREDFTSPVGTAADDTNPWVPPPFTSVDDTHWHTFDPEVEFVQSRQLSIVGGWHYERWRISDYTYDGFAYVNNYQSFFPFGVAVNGLALETGGFLPAPYHANVVYIRLKVGF